MIIHRYSLRYYKDKELLLLSSLLSLDKRVVPITTAGSGKFNANINIALAMKIHWELKVVRYSELDSVSMTNWLKG